MIVVAVVRLLFAARKEIAGAGADCRRRLRRVTQWILSTFVLVFIFILLDMAVAAGWLAMPLLGPALNAGTCEADLLKIYSLSALRLLPFVPVAALPVARIGFDVAADILFYLHDGSEVRRRLRTMVADLANSGEVVVWGHSQGARIAVDALFWNKESGAPPVPASGRLATSGAPVATLYGGFLDHPDLPPPRPGWSWANFWRSTDVVGGAIPSTDSSWPKDEPVPMHPTNTTPTTGSSPP